MRCTVHSPACRSCSRSSVSGQTAQLLEGLGHQVEASEPEIDGQALARDFLRIWFAHLAHQIQTTRESVQARSDDFELDSLALAASVRARSAQDYAASYVRWGQYGYRLSRFLERYDVFMTPTLAEPPARIGQGSTPGWAAGLARAALPLGFAPLFALAADAIERVAIDQMRSMPFTQLANVTGVPAMSVPLHTFPGGLPLGIHFLAEHGCEGLLFSLAGQLERAAPWRARRPELSK